MVKIITLIDINDAIMDTVTSALVDTEFDDVEFSSTNIIENITRPSFYIDFENGRTNKFNYSLKERNLQVKLFYFAKKRDGSKIELLKIQDILENVFLEEIVVSESFHFPVSEVEVDIIKKEGYLTVTLDLYSLENIEYIGQVDTSEYADTLIYNQINN